MVRVLAHRGACRQARENTLEAFVRAIDLGADGVELDVRRTADGALVVHHDATVPGFGVLAEHTLEEIRREVPHAPTLAAALDACATRMVNVEVKNLPGDADFDEAERAATGVVELLHDRRRRDHVLVSSFSLDSIGRVRDLDPSVPTALLTLLGFDPLEGAGLAHDRGHRAIHPDVRSLAGPMARAVAARAHDLGLDVNVWTVNAPDEIARLGAAGVDGVVTDVPDVALRALGRA